MAVIGAQHREVSALNTQRVYAEATDEQVKKSRCDKNSFGPQLVLAWPRRIVSTVFRRPKTNTLKLDPAQSCADALYAAVRAERRPEGAVHLLERELDKRETGQQHGAADAGENQCAAFAAGTHGLPIESIKERWCICVVVVQNTMPVCRFALPVCLKIISRIRLVRQRNPEWSMISSSGLAKPE